MITIKLTEGFEAGIPKRCEYCPFMNEKVLYDDDDYRQYYTQYCGLTCTYIGMNCEPSGRLSNCPIVSIEEES